MARKITLAAWALLGLAGCSDWYSTSLRKDYVDIMALEDALHQYATQNGGSYPDSLEALAVPDALGFQYLKKEQVPLDPWGNAYRYDAPSVEGGLLRVYTYGSDGMPGGKGDEQDVDNLTIRRLVARSRQ